LLPLGGAIGFLPHEQLHHHLAIAVHRSNPPNTLWAVADGGAIDTDGRFGKTGGGRWRWLRGRFLGGRAEVRHGGGGGDGDSEGWDADRKGRSGRRMGRFGCQEGPAGRNPTTNVISRV
jgi:hypothetical protein